LIHWSNMKTTTAGGRSKFSYTGSLADGFKLMFPSKPILIKSEIINSLLSAFKGQSVLGGFHATKSPEGSVGHYISTYQSNTMKSSLSPVYGSHIIGILRDLELVSVSKEKSSVVVKFSN